MHHNAELIREFYRNFAKGDVAGMRAVYHPDVVFSDPVFPSLHGEQVFSMWRMLTEHSGDFRVDAGQFEADDKTGTARWEAIYVFSKTGRQVHNLVEARFEFRDGKIVRHEDSFDLHRWATMALGLKGRLLGWLKPVQQSIQSEAAKSLHRYIKKTQKSSEPPAQPDPRP